MKLKRTLQEKILTPSKAAAWAKKLKASKKKIVFTNGCFDILHPGHVSYLQSARNEGDVLIVALDTDAAVRSQKGPSRPVNPLASRSQVIASLESVDAVTYFSGSNPVGIIKKLKPHVLCKGGDWKTHQILGAKEVLSWGGKVRSLNFVEGKSTTNIIKKIKSKTK